MKHAFRLLFERGIKRKMYSGEVRSDTEHLGWELRCSRRGWLVGWAGVTPETDLLRVCVNLVRNDETCGARLHKAGEKGLQDGQVVAHK